MAGNDTNMTDDNLSILQPQWIIFPYGRFIFFKDENIYLRNNLEKTKNNISFSKDSFSSSSFFLFTTKTKWLKEGLLGAADSTAEIL